MNNLFHFLTNLAVNPQQQIAFATQPNAMMIAAKLSPAERNIVESKMSKKITDIFTTPHTLLASVCVDPGPDPLPDPDPPSKT